MNNFRNILPFVFVLAIVGCSNTVERSLTTGLSPDGPLAARNKTQSSDDLPPSIDLSEPGQSVSTVVAAQVIDTNQYVQQVYRTEPYAGEPATKNGLPIKSDIPPLEIGPMNNLVPGGLSDIQRVSEGPFFPGISNTPWSPPDPTIAVGMNHIVETVNMEVAFFSKDGTVQFQQRLDSSGSPGFLEDIGGGNFTFDPKCFYDHYEDRFLLIALERYSDSSESYITLAISDDGDPNGIWYKYRTWSVVEISNEDFWVDYPGLGYDANGYYITNNLFGFNGGFGGVLVRTIDKTPMLTGSPLTFNDVRDPSSSSIQVAQHFGANSAPIIVSRQSGSQLKITAINNAFTNPTLQNVAVNVPAFSSADNAPNTGGGLIESGLLGTRLMNVHWRDGKLWTAHSVLDSGGSRSVARWYEVDMGDWPNGGSPSLNQSGEIDLGGDQWTFFPAIYTNDNGGTAMVYGQSSPTEFVSVHATGRLASDSIGTMGSTTELMIGDASASGRWGDYFDIAVDPTDGTTFWMVGEYQTSSGWVTSINSFTLDEPQVVIGESVTVTQGDLAVGGIEQLELSDNVDLSISRSLTDVVSRTELVIQAVSPYQEPSGVDIRLEGSVFARTAVDQAIDMYNYDSDSWEEVDARAATRFVDSTVEFSVTGEASRFIQPGTGQIEARVRFNSPVARQRFTSNTDQFQWTINP